MFFMRIRIVITQLIIATLLLTVASCKKFLEVEPQFKFNDELATNTLDGCAKTVTGAFSQIQSGNLYGGGIIANSEYLADFVTSDPISDFSLNQLRTRSMNPFNGEATGMWSDAYRAIHICNLVLQKLPQFESENPALVNTLRGECYFIRACMHYELVRMFAQPSGFTADDSHPGIPVRLTPGSTTEGQNTPRAKVSEVYAQIIADLETAEALLPADKTVRASKYAAQAFLAKAYFSQNKFSSAKIWADEIINNSGLSLNDSVNQIYNMVGWVQTNEVIFQIINISNDRENGKLTGRFRSGTFPAMYRAWDTYRPYISTDSAQGSLRYSLLRKTGPKYFTRKYDNLDMNVVVVRLAEIYLLRAECRAQLNEPNSDVRADYNIVRQRAGLSPDNTTFGQQNLLNEIWKERDTELCFEGDRFFEVKRRKGTFNTPVGVYEWNSPKLIYPIPQQEVEQNPSMTQNEGY